MNIEKSDKTMYRSALLFMGLMLIGLYSIGLLEQGLVVFIFVLGYIVWDLTKENPPTEVHQTAPEKSPQKPL